MLIFAQNPVAMEELTYKQIKEKVGDAWALIYNPVYSEKTGKLLKGQLVAYSSSKKKLARKVRNDKAKNKHFTILWLGEIPDDNILLNFF